jgi:hypothetical protein
LQTRELHQWLPERSLIPLLHLPLVCGNHLGYHKGSLGCTAAAADVKSVGLMPHGLQLLQGSLDDDGVQTKH